MSFEEWMASRGQSPGGQLQLGSGGVPKSGVPNYGQGGSPMDRISMAGSPQKDVAGGFGQRLQSAVGPLQDAYNTPWGRGLTAGNISMTNWERGAPGIGEGVGGTAGSLAGLALASGPLAPVVGILGGLAGRKVGGQVGKLFGKDKLEEAKKKAKEEARVQGALASLNELAGYYLQRNQGNAFLQRSRFGG